MPVKSKDKLSIGLQIKSHFNRSQAWLAQEIGMTESQLSRKINGYVEWSQVELDKINEILGTKFKI